MKRIDEKMPGEGYCIIAIVLGWIFFIVGIFQLVHVIKSPDEFLKNNPGIKGFHPIFQPIGIVIASVLAFFWARFKIINFYCDKKFSFIGKIKMAFKRVNRFK